MCPFKTPVNAHAAPMTTRWHTSGMLSVAHSSSAPGVSTPVAATADASAAAGVPIREKLMPPWQAAGAAADARAWSSPHQLLGALWIAKNDPNA